MDTIMQAILIIVTYALFLLEPLKAEKVKYDTSDGVKIVADYYAPTTQPDRDKKAPVAILIHMYPLTRDSWGPLIPSLHEAGFAILAYDIRGMGGGVDPASK